MSIAISKFADRINEIIPVIMRSVFTQQTNELCKGKITLPQFVILDFLDRHGESKMTDLARSVGVTTAAMTGLVGRLVKYVYVERVLDPSDRRIIKVRVTNKGGKLVVNINQQRRQMIIKIFANVTEKDREEYLRILTKINSVLSQQ